MEIINDSSAYGDAGAPCPEARNSKDIPFLATAGMRLLTTKQNSKVWDMICGKEGTHGYLGVISCDLYLFISVGLFWT